MSLAGRAAVGTLVAGFLLLLILFPAGPVRAQAGTTVNVAVQVHVSPIYDVYGVGTSVVYGVISASSLSISQDTTMTLRSSSPPTIGTRTANVSGVAENVDYTLLGKISGLYEINFTIHPGTTSFLINFQESQGGSSFLWRYVVHVPYVAVSFPGLFVPLVTTVVAPSGTILSQLYTAGGASLPSSDATFAGSTAGQSTYTFTTDGGLIVMQSRLFLPASIAITSVALAVLALAALNLLPEGQLLLARITDPIKSLHLPRIRKGFRLRAILQSRKLLTIFLLCSLVMAAGAALGGPAPRVTAYVLAAPGSVAEIQSNLQQVAGNVQVVTPSEDFTDFAVMSSVGQFNMVIVSNYPAAGISQVAPYILSGLGNVPVIVIDNSPSNSALAGPIKDLYSDSFVSVQNASSLTGSEKTSIALQLAENKRSNLLGITLSAEGFQVLAFTEAVLSMALVFLGWAYLGSLAAESDSRTDLSRIVTVIGAGIFVFVFSEAIYIAVSSLLAFPLSLHAVNSDAHDITAIGLLGFGGGSTPRLAAGFLGVIVGLVGPEGGLSVRKSDFALVSAIILVLVANPFSIGQFVFQGLLAFFPLVNVGPATGQLGTAYASSLSIKGFIYGVGSALGGGVTPQYLLSAGKILFFAGLVPLAYLKKMGRTTTAIAVLAIALVVGDGAVRVGEMTPDKTVIAILPGLIIGFAFVVVLLGFAVVEKYVRGNWRSKG